MKGRVKTSDDLLLDAVLADENWDALNRTLRDRALQVLEARRRQRRRLFQGAQVIAVTLLSVIAAVTWLNAGSRPKPASVASVGVLAPVVAEAHAQFVSEEQMLALFPKGSCVLAEVDGQKQLVFFDGREAQEGFVVSASVGATH